MVFDHSVQDRQQLAHTGRQGDLRRLTSGPQALVERFAPGMMAGRHEGPHRPRGPHVGTPSPGLPTAPEGAAIPVPGGHPDQGSQPLATQCAHLRQVKPSRAGTDGANPRDAAEQRLTFPPHRTRPPRRVEVVVQGCQSGVELGEMGLDVRLEPRGRTPEAVLFGGPPGDQWPPPRQQGTKLAGLGVRQRPGHRADGLSNMHEGPRVERIRLGQLSGGPSNVTRVAGIDHPDGQARCRPLGHHGPLIVPGRFEHHERRGDLLESRDEEGDPRVIIGDRPAAGIGVAGAGCPHGGHWRARTGRARLPDDV